jgi:hypothetical protein
MNHKHLLIIGVALAIVTVFLSSHSMAGPRTISPAADTSNSPGAETSPPTAGAGSGKIRATPFKGMIASVDDKAKTFTIAGKEDSRELKITDKTIITKSGQPATMKDVVANEEVRGSYYKMADGSMEAKNVKLGPLTDAENAEKEARRAKRQEKKTATAPGTSASPSVSPST